LIDWLVGWLIGWLSAKFASTAGLRLVEISKVGLVMIKIILIINFSKN